MAKDYNGDKLRLLAHLSYGKVLDVGFGDRPNANLVVHTGIDIIARKKPKNYLNIVQTRAESFSTKVKKPFDTIIAADVIEHMENPSAFLRECRKALAPTGILLITTPTPYYPILAFFELTMDKRYYNHDSHINLFSPRIMLKLLASTGFECIEMKGMPCYLDFMLPKLLHWQILYICKKGERLNLEEEKKKAKVN